MIGHCCLLLSSVDGQELLSAFFCWTLATVVCFSYSHLTIVCFVYSSVYQLSINFLSSAPVIICWQSSTFICSFIDNCLLHLPQLNIICIICIRLLPLRVSSDECLQSSTSVEYHLLRLHSLRNLSHYNHLFLSLSLLTSVCIICSSVYHLFTVICFVFSYVYHLLTTICFV